jgi:cysteine-rich repeat protein
MRPSLRSALAIFALSLGLSAAGGAEPAPFCGDGTEDVDEECDDGNTAGGDGCSAICEEEPSEPEPGCPDAPDLLCKTAVTAALSINEKQEENEKVAASLKMGAGTTTAADLGDPPYGSVYDVCVYDAAGDLALAMQVDRGGDLCGAKPCWKAAKSGRGFAFGDPLAESDGVSSLKAAVDTKGSAAVSVSAKNSAAKELASLPTGTASALEGSPEVTLQIRVHDAACFGAVLPVKKADGLQVKAKKKK